MKCRQCAAEIAEKAIVCYRCGAPTADPVHRHAPAARRSRTLILIVVGVAIGVAIALGVWLAMRSQ